MAIGMASSRTQCLINLNAGLVHVFPIFELAWHTRWYHRLDLVIQRAILRLTSPMPTALRHIENVDVRIT